MFERFTNESRRVLVLAQEEARLLYHNFIGTEHILLGLIHQGGVGARALGSLDIHLEAVRVAVQETIGPAGTWVTGSPPFTPRAKKVLELSLREALQLGHTYIGTEHILLGLIREGEGVAAQVLVGLGADLSRVRQAVIQLLSGADAPSPEGEGVGGPAPVVHPHCSRCHANLAEFARYTRIEAAPGDEAVEAQGPLSLTVLYCGRCGSVLGAPAAMGPELMGPEVIGPVISTVSARPRRGPAANQGPVRKPGPEAKRARAFLDELLVPVRLEDVPEGARVELSYLDDEILEGTVAGTEVRLTGRVGSHRGPLQGTWGAQALRANWRLGDNSRTPAGPLPGIIAGHFGDSRFKLKGYFQRSPQYFFEQAEIIGDLCGQALRVEVSAAEGGLGSTSTVVAEGTLGEETFELFAALSGDLTRAVVRGSFAERPVSLDVTHNKPVAVRIVGDYIGPLPLVALMVGTVLYFL
jgi:hypothetical protein